MKATVKRMEREEEMQGKIREKEKKVLELRELLLTEIEEEIGTVDRQMEKEKKEIEERDKEIFEIGEEVLELEMRLAILVEKKEMLRSNNSKSLETVEELVQRRDRVERGLAEVAEGRRSEIGLLVSEVAALGQELARLVGEGREEEVRREEEARRLQDSREDTAGQLIQFIDSSIKEKEAELECPVCLEVLKLFFPFFFKLYIFLSTFWL